jgi:hypothetical protein
MSREITDRIEAGDLSMKPGWVRLSLHPTMTNDELNFILSEISETSENADKWMDDYCYDMHTNEFHHSSFPDDSDRVSGEWFTL